MFFLLKEVKKGKNEQLDELKITVISTGIEIPHQARCDYLVLLPLRVP